MKVLICGLPRQGKTVLAEALAKFGAVHFNADFIRANINKDLGFSLEDRIEHATRMGILCDLVTRAGHVAIADFVCPTEQTRQAFNADFVIWVDTQQHNPYQDTQSLFEPPQYDIKLTDWNYSVEEIWEKIKTKQ